MPEQPLENKLNNLLDKMPPANGDVEKAVLGVMLAYKDAPAFAIDSLRPDDFYFFGHDKIFQAMQNIYSRGEAVNPITVGHEMKKNNWLEDVGGNLYLIDLSKNAIDYIGNRFIECIKIIETLGMKRRLVAPLAIAVNQCYEIDKEPNHIIDSLQQAFYDILRMHRTGDPISLRTIFKNEMEYIESVSHGEKLPGIATGFTKFDLHIGSIFPGDLFVLAGVPGSGKTVFATEMALNAAIRYGKKVLFISMEMYEKKYAPRLISNQAAVPHRVARLRDYRGDNIKYLENIYKKAKDVTENYFAHMEGPLTPIEIKTKAKKHAILHGMDLLVVDHLHEMKALRPNDTRYDRATYGAEIMKEIGMELKIPVVLLSQLSRELNYRQDPRPRMSDLRDSGNIEAKADIVAMIFRPGMYDGTDSTDMELGLVKYRDDQNKIFKFRLNGNFMKYEEVDESTGTDNRSASEWHTDPF